MLLNLNITGLAVVESLSLELQHGMSVLTGETGAGKSILLTALGLALGDRADSSYIRPGSKRAEINLEFDLSDATAAMQWLQDHELDEDEHCIIRRIINSDGRSKAYINNRPATLQALQALSEKLIEIHGQHAHLNLLHGEEQRRLLDSSADNGKRLQNLNAVYTNWKTFQTEQQQLINAADNKARQEELLSYQLHELQQLELATFDYSALSDEHSRQANIDNILSSGQQQLDLLYENEQQSINQMLNHSIQALTTLSGFAPELQDINTLLEEAQVQIEEACHQLRRFLEIQEADPMRMEWLESQLEIIHGLSRKHQVKPEELPKLAEDLQQQLASLDHDNNRLEFLAGEIDRLRCEYHQQASALTEQRQKTAQQLQQKISTVVQELGMPHGEFSIHIETLPDSDPKFNGLDSIEFRVSTNPGLPHRALAKVASGGELSRISLAIQVATLHNKTVPTMIFDEVDAGIGGGIAEIVGQKLRSLGRNRQVMCVTHLPQVAAQAHHHLFVVKNNQTEITSSRVETLTDKQRTQEIARMLGGIHITDQTLAHAHEMLSSASEKA